jgi:two-component SAPR family response regulator
MTSNNNSLQVIICDDDKVVLFIHNLIVRKSDLAQDAIAFSNARDTLDFLLENKNNACILLLDINMPEMSGWEFLESIDNANLDKVYVIIVSSSVDKLDHDKAGQYKQVIGYLEKPIDVKSFNKITETISLRNKIKLSNEN